MILAKTMPDAEAAPPTTWSQHEAFLAVLLLVAVSDVQKHVPRLRTVDGYVRRSPFLRPLGEQGRAALHSSAARHLGAEDPLAQACAAIDPATAASLYAHTLDILIDDEPLCAREEALIARLGALLHLDAVEAAHIREVIALKNKY